MWTEGPIGRTLHGRAGCSGPRAGEGAKCTRSFPCEHPTSGLPDACPFLLSVAWQVCLGVVALCFIDRETEAQSGEVICLNSHSQDLNPGRSDTGPCILNSWPDLNPCSLCESSTPGPFATPHNPCLLRWDPCEKERSALGAEPTSQSHSHGHHDLMLRRGPQQGSRLAWCLAVKKNLRSRLQELQEGEQGPGVRRRGDALALREDCASLLPAPTEKPRAPSGGSVCSADALWGPTLRQAGVWGWGGGGGAEPHQVPALMGATF